MGGSCSQVIVLCLPATTSSLRTVYYPDCVISAGSSESSKCAPPFPSVWAELTTRQIAYDMVLIGLTQGENERWSKNNVFISAWNNKHRYRPLRETSGNASHRILYR